jgi:hypothetical protein
MRARHLHVRPHVSATYTSGDACLIVHGAAQEVTEQHPMFDGWTSYVRSVYGGAVDAAKQRYAARKGAEFTGYIEPRRIYAQGFPCA